MREKKKITFGVLTICGCEHGVEETDVTCVAIIICRNCCDVRARLHTVQTVVCADELHVVCYSDEGVICMLNRLRWVSGNCMLYIMSRAGTVVVEVIFYYFVWRQRLLSQVLLFHFSLFRSLLSLSVSLTVSLSLFLSFSSFLSSSSLLFLFLLYLSVRLSFFLSLGFLAPGSGLCPLIRQGQCRGWVGRGPLLTLIIMIKVFCGGQTVRIRADYPLQPFDLCAWSIDVGPGDATSQTNTDGRIEGRELLSNHVAAEVAGSAVRSGS